MSSEKRCIIRKQDKLKDFSCKKKYNKERTERRTQRVSALLTSLAVISNDIIYLTQRVIAPLTQLAVISNDIILFNTKSECFVNITCCNI